MIWSQKTTASYAAASPESLHEGHTSKQGNAKLAGCHGEGLKLAALVMSRNGYKAKITRVHQNDSTCFLLIFDMSQGPTALARFLRIWYDDPLFSTTLT
jgi:hypothetical protein